MIRRRWGLFQTLHASLCRTVVSEQRHTHPPPIVPLGRANPIVISYHLLHAGRTGIHYQYGHPSNLGFVSGAGHTFWMTGFQCDSAGSGLIETRLCVGHRGGVIWVLLSCFCWSPEAPIVSSSLRACGLWPGCYKDRSASLRLWLQGLRIKGANLRVTSEGLGLLWMFEEGDLPENTSRVPPCGTPILKWVPCRSSLRSALPKGPCREIHLWVAPFTIACLELQGAH